MGRSEWDYTVPLQEDIYQLEPILIVFLGVIVGGIVIALFLPIFQMSEVIAG